MVGWSYLVIAMVTVARKFTSTHSKFTQDNDVSAYPCCLPAGAYPCYQLVFSSSQLLGSLLVDQQPVTGNQPVAVNLLVESA